MLSMVASGSRVLPITESQQLGTANRQSANATALSGCFASRMDTTDTSLPHARVARPHREWWEPFGRSGAPFHRKVQPIPYLIRMRRAGAPA
jgi:hypothetical protein